MFFVDTIEVPGLGNRSYLAGGGRTAVAVDPPRDHEPVIAAAAPRRVRGTHVGETWSFTQSSLPPREGGF
ncbi:hypothetical protein ACFW7O_24220, partial [Streptomyces diastatochromogenes]